MDKDKRETYGQACQIARSMLFVGGAQYDKHKNESKYCLGYKCLKHLSFSERVRAGESGTVMRACGDKSEDYG